MGRFRDQPRGQLPVVFGCRVGIVPLIHDENAPVPNPGLAQLPVCLFLFLPSILPFALHGTPLRDLPLHPSDGPPAFPADRLHASCSPPLPPAAPFPSTFAYSRNKQRKSPFASVEPEVGILPSIGVYELRPDSDSDWLVIILATSGGSSTPCCSRIFSMRSRSAFRPFSIARFSTASLAANIT